MRQQHPAQIRTANCDGGHLPILPFGNISSIDIFLLIAPRQSFMSKPLTILCIDDEPKGLTVRKMLLESQGYEVLTATSGREGLAIFVRHRVAAVVLDYAMPEMNGAEVAAVLKRLDPAVKILLYSAYVNLSKEDLRWVDASATKGDHPKAFFGAVQQLFSCSNAASHGDSCGQQALS